MKSPARIMRLSATVALLCLLTAWGLSIAFAAPPAENTQRQSTPIEEANLQAEKPELGQEWVRIRRDKEGKPLALEVAVIRYVPSERADQPAARAREYVDLVGAVHIGDRRYYQELNKRFRGYDSVLYELVAPEGTVVERGRGTSSLNPLGAMQNGMKAMLEVEHQLEQIDYTRPNFVHADLSPEEFFASMEERNEGFMQLYFRMIGQAVAQQSQQAVEGESSELDILSALLSKDRPRQLKIAMAKQFESMESLLVVFSGPDGSTLITERNKRALEVLRREQAAGKRKLGIFYGAGHLVDMHERLVEEFDMQPVEATWVEAWDLRAK